MTMKRQPPSNAPAEAPSAMPDAPHTLEGYAMLHQFFRLRRRQWNALDRNQRAAAIAQAAPVFAAMAHREDGESALFTELGHKGDLIVLHFRRTLDDLAAAERELERL
jgi:chlorite dismutase